jgi:hypothetical protein
MGIGKAIHSGMQTAPDVCLYELRPVPFQNRLSDEDGNSDSLGRTLADIE